MTNKFQDCLKFQVLTAMSMAHLADCT